ncbi:carbon storage regulator [uncultured Pseudoteredinibacter sp.]|uniref:carbon storage regulator n=1 Tax=uncultured Pseudoteredinibacter sp. TaxID=1641701 RepID=UPI002616276C|nr:carbon storage regulator [uncultured Pseudoteredinibacter sp.]MCV6624015.1 carbon storage regulator [Cellvibrionaceae bacterium]
MLTLTRKAGQKLIIGDDVCIEIVSISGRQVAVGVSAPDSVRIYREEIAPEGLLDSIMDSLHKKKASNGNK